MSQEDAIRQLLEQGTYEGDYGWEPFSYDVLGSVPGIGAEKGEWSIYHEILKRIGQTPDFDYFNQAPDPDAGKPFSPKTTPIGQILSTARSNKPDIENLKNTINAMFPDFNKWVEDLTIADRNSRTLYMATERGEATDPYVAQAKEVYPTLNKAVWDTVDKVSEALVSAGKKQYESGLYAPYTKGGATY